MRKQMEESAAAAGARRATGAAAGRGRGERFSARRKRAAVLRLLRGEDLESVSRELRSRCDRRCGRSKVLKPGITQDKWDADSRGVNDGRGSADRIVVQDV